MLTNAHEPDAATQVEMFRHTALPEANDERSRKVHQRRLVMPYYSCRGQEMSGALHIAPEAGETCTVGTVLGTID